MIKKLSKFFLTLACLAVILPAHAFKDIRIDLTNGNLLTEAEIADQNITTFGVAIGDDGTPTRVAADDANAAIVLTGKFHSKEHGWGDFSSTVKVDGPVKISMGSCNWGGDVNVTNEAGETVLTFNTNTGACYHGNKEENIVSGNYKGEATTLTIAGGSYTPYIAVEAIEGEIVEDVVLTFDLGNYAGCGTAPESVKGEPGTKATIPANYTMYVEGKTLTGWTDGAKTYAAGDELTLTDNVTLTPVFTDNKVSLDDRLAAVTIKWNFERRYGAPTVGYQNVNTIWVTQAIVNGETIDVKMDLDTNNGGKFANGNWTDWCQINNGTVMTIPSCPGATIQMEAYGAAAGTTINGQEVNPADKTFTYKVESEGETAEVMPRDGSYYRYLQITLPVVQETKEFTLTYAFGDYADCGQLPESVTGEAGTEAIIPVNYTMYVEGKTLKGWTDGDNTYVPGDKLSLFANKTLTPVFTDNTTSLADRVNAVTVKWEFQRKNGAPQVQYEKVNAIWVAQAKVNGETIDVKMNVDATSGKMANGSWTDWCQFNKGTILTIPSCVGATVTMEAYATPTGTTIDGEDVGATDKTFTYRVPGEKEAVDVVIAADGKYYRYLTVVLPYVPKTSGDGKTFSGEKAVVTWPFNDAGNLDACNITPEDGFSTASVNLNGAECTGTGTSVHAEGVTFAKIKPAKAATDAVEWSVKPAMGLTFTPTKVSAYIARFGTDAENGVVVKAKKADGSYITLGTYTAPRNNQNASQDKYSGNTNYKSHVEITLTEAQQKQLASTEGFVLSATIGVGNTKEGGFSEVIVEGVLDGTIASVAKYSLTAVASPAEGGTVKVNPAAEQYDDGTVVNVSTEPAFGYKFINWTNQDGKQVSTKTSFDYTVTSDATLTANFQKLNIYELKVSTTGGANNYQVQLTPAPTVIDGRNMYEEGTNVTLNAVSNPIVTFTNWADGTSSSELVVKMDSDKEIEACFDAVDYIVGWDFYMPGADGRLADFASEGNDAVNLVLRNAEGKVEGWLDKSQVAAGGYEGRPGAVNWRTYELGEFYWQTCINAEAFTDIKIATAMALNYNAYPKQDIEYSLDGENWTKVGTITLTKVKTWVDANITLPADANNQPKVYIRWISDKSSTPMGTSSANDGIALGATYITGTKALVDDGTAPVLVAVVPEADSNTASINGKIVLTFDEKVKVNDNTTATLNKSMVLEPQVAGKTVMFNYNNLKYNTDYQFVLEGNSVADLTDNYYTDDIVINFTTKSRDKVEKMAFDFVVPDDGTLEKAFAAAESRTDTSVRFRIFIRNGNYVLPASETATKKGSDGNDYPDPTTQLSTPNVSIIGESMNGVVITNSVPASPSSGANVLEGIGNGDVLRLNKDAQNYYFQNLTMKSAMGDAHGRDIVLNDNSNKTIMKDVCLWGYQDTYVSNNENARFYFEGGVLRGRTDFLCGKGDVYYNAVTLQMCEKGGYLAVPSRPTKYGYIFKDCEIVAEKSDINGNYTLGRPWGSGTPIALYIDTRMTAQPSAIGWNEMSGGWPARFAEYNSMTANGTVIDLKDRKKTFGDGYENNPFLTKEEAEFHSYERVMGGDDGWDPATLAEQAPAPRSVSYYNGWLYWENDDYTLLWAVTRNGEIIGFTTVNKFEIPKTEATRAAATGEDVYAVRAANEMGGLGEAVVAQDGTVTGVTMPEVNTAVAREYYNVEGVKVSRDYKGVVIMVETTADGRKIATKYINK